MTCTLPASEIFPVRYNCSFLYGLMLGEREEFKQPSTTAKTRTLIIL